MAGWLLSRIGGLRLMGVNDGEPVARHDSCNGNGQRRTVAGKDNKDENWSNLPNDLGTLLHHSRNALILHRNLSISRVGAFKLC